MSEKMCNFAADIIFLHMTLDQMWLENARKAKELHSYSEAAKYYTILNRPTQTDWEIAFNTIYCKWAEASVDEINRAMEEIERAIDKSIPLIHDHVSSYEEQQRALAYIAEDVITMVTQWMTDARERYQQRRYTDFVPVAIALLQDSYNGALMVIAHLTRAIDKSFGEYSFASVCVPVLHYAIDIAKSGRGFTRTPEAYDKMIALYERILREYERQNKY